MKEINKMAKREINPFVVGRYVSDEYFCDRRQETDTLIKQIQNGRNITLISDRRLGKSGLIEHVFAQNSIKDHFYTIYVDIYSTNSLAELVQLFGTAIYNVIKEKMSWKERFFQIISSLRVGFKLDALTGMPTFDIGIGDIVAPPLTLEQIFAFLESLERSCVVAFDEFQQIALYDEKNIEALLRTHIQKCKNVQFIFSGSKKHLMSQMFLSPAKPFYQSTINLGLEPISKAVYVVFAQSMFEKRNKHIGTETVEQIYDMFRGITWYMQLMLNEMFTLTPVGETCEREFIQMAVENVIRIQAPFYMELLATLPSKQKTLLYAIAKERIAKNITSEAFVRRNGLSSASSVQSALRGLRDKDIVIDVTDGVAIYDVFLERFIVEQ